MCHASKIPVTRDISSTTATFSSLGFYQACYALVVRCYHVTGRDGFMQRGALGHLNYWGPTQV